ncbi:hypothetical protein [Gluconobacter cerinus]|uniref:hypothetical protein n=1 Tax=Gluconobacter cerinus TaxID=38307 RepID=UPI001C05BB34|nr:hypothetical protein [Gluconobacter cerinus]
MDTSEPRIVTRASRVEGEQEEEREGKKQKERGAAQAVCAGKGWVSTRPRPDGLRVVEIPPLRGACAIAAILCLAGEVIKEKR